VQLQNCVIGVACVHACMIATVHKDVSVLLENIGTQPRTRAITEMPYKLLLHTSQNMYMIICSFSFHGSHVLL